MPPSPKDHAGEIDGDFEKTEQEFNRLREDATLRRRETLMIGLNVLFEQAKEEKRSLTVPRDHPEFGTNCSRTEILPERAAESSENQSDHLKVYVA
jgi:hypothetical protein